MGSEFLETKVGQVKKVRKRTMGGGSKIKFISVDFANVTDPKTGLTKKAKILTVVENPANPHFKRRNVLTKGAIIETEMGRAKVTSRPNQNGVVNAVLLPA